MKREKEKEKEEKRRRRRKKLSPGNCSKQANVILLFTTHFKLTQMKVDVHMFLPYLQTVIMCFFVTYMRTVGAPILSFWRLS